MTSAYEVVVVGGGVNGLVAACYLARAGRRVLLIEARDRLGGVASADEIHPGFHASLETGDVPLFLDRVVRDLRLGRHGLTRKAGAGVATGLGLGDDLVSVWREPDRTRSQLARRSPTDAARLEPFLHRMERFAAVLRATAHLRPPRPAGASATDILPWLPVGLRVRGLGRADLMELLRVLPLPVGDLLDERFETGVLKGLLATAGLTGLTVGPYGAGTTYVALYQRLGAAGEARSAAGRVRGGAPALVTALERAAAAYGVTIRKSAEVTRIPVRDGRAVSVIVAGNEEIGAGAVVSGLDPVRTLLGLVGPTELPLTTVRRLRSVRLRASTAWVHLALDGLPDVRPFAVDDPRLRGRLLFTTGLDHLERAADDAKHGEPSREPLLDVWLPSLVDPSVAPPGKHLVTARVQYVPHGLSADTWRGRGSQLGDRVVQLLEERLLPGLSGRLLARKVVTPADLEQELGLTGGDVHHGQMGLDQLFFMRPVPECAQYATPVANLYLCGAGSHPGGGVTGAPGHNAARQVLRDRRRSR